MGKMEFDERLKWAVPIKLFVAQSYFSWFFFGSLTVSLGMSTDILKQ